MELNNCPSCGGKVEFSPIDKALKCIKCEKIYPIIFKKNIEKRPLEESENDEGYKKWENSSRSFQCSNCGAKVVLTDFEMSTKCQYCQTHSLVPLNSLPGLKPDKVLPFKISKENASAVFRTRVASKFFLPRAFKKNVPIDNLGATYISSFDFSYNVLAKYHGIESYTKTVVDREGNRKTVTRTRPISGSINHYFGDIAIEVSDKISQDDIQNILPYNFKEAYDYDSGFIKGYSVGYYNQSVNEGFEKAKEVTDERIEQMIRSKYETLISLKVNSIESDEKYYYCLLPVYFINYKYKNKEYTNLMNGQNGNVGGKVPRSATKIALVVILAILLVIGVPLLIVLLTNI